MDDKIVKVIKRKDKSVGRLLKKTSKKIRKSVQKSNSIESENNLKPKRPVWKMILFSVLNIMSILFILLTTTIFMVGIVNRSRNVPPSFAGFHSLIIESHSMENSGLYKGNSAVVKSVSISELKKDDIIAFYVYNKTLEDVYLKDFQVASTEEILAKPEQMTLKKLFGVKSSIITEAVESNSTLVIHHIKEIYKDENGIIWFSTYGSSNGYTDEWLIREDLVIGKLETSNFASVIVSIIEFLNNPIGLFLLILIPLTYLIFSIISELLYKKAIKKLQRQVLRGERCLTDIVCVKHNVGYSMNKKEKLQVLATSPNELKTTYLSLLWENGSAPNSIRKHYLKKNIFLSIYAEYNELDRTVALMYKDGVDEKIIAKYYIGRKNEIAEKEAKYTRKLKKIKLTKF